MLPHFAHTELVAQILSVDNIFPKMTIWPSHEDAHGLSEISGRRQYVDRATQWHSFLSALNWVISSWGRHQSIGNKAAMRQGQTMKREEGSCCPWYWSLRQLYAHPTKLNQSYPVCCCCVEGLVPASVCSRTGKSASERLNMSHHNKERRGWVLQACFYNKEVSLRNTSTAGGNTQ